MKKLHLSPNLRRLGRCLSDWKGGQGCSKYQESKGKSWEVGRCMGMDICWVKGTTKGRTLHGRDPQGKVDILSPFCGNFSKAGPGRGGEGGAHRPIC